MGLRGLILFKFGLKKLVISSVMFSNSFHWLHNNLAVQHRFQIIKQLIMCKEYPLNDKAYVNTKNLHQYGTVQYHVYTGYPVPGINNNTKNLHQYGTVQYHVYTGYPVPGISIWYWNGIGMMCMLF